MENLKILLRRNWLWLLVYAALYSGVTTLAIYRFSLMPLVPICLSLLPLIVLPIGYLVAIGWIGIRRKLLSNQVLRRLTESTGLAMLTTVVTILPAVILSLANTQAHFGAFLGDQLGLPRYMLWMTIGVLLLSGAVQATTALLSYQPARQAYREAREKRQKEPKPTNHQ